GATEVTHAANTPGPARGRPPPGRCRTGTGRGPRRGSAARHRGRVLRGLVPGERRAVLHPPDLDRPPAPPPRGAPGRVSRPKPATRARRSAARRRPPR